MKFIPQRGAFAPVPITRAACAVTFSLLFAGTGAAQASPQHSQNPTPLAALLAEASRNNPQIQAARGGTQAARQVPAQVTALPDPTAQVQQVNVGSPRPFAGYSNDEFANVGLGISQEIPYPGKLKLRGEVAKRDADIAGNREDSVSRSVLSQVKDAYFHLGYLTETLAILNNDREILKQMEGAAEARYRSGMGNQQDVLQAQLQQTKLLRDISAHHLEVGKIQVSLKQLLNRPQWSPDIEPVTLAETPLGVSYDELMLAAQAQNPDLAATQNIIERQRLQVDAAHKDFYPDFTAGFMYNRTDPAQFRAQYEFTLGIKIPLHHDKQRAELAQAQIELDRSRSDREAQSQQLAADMRQQYLIEQQTAELLKINREGLLPQARAGYQAGLAAYSNTSLRDLLKVMNIGEGSFYNTLKSKKNLYLVCVQHYRERVALKRESALYSAPSAREGVRAMFKVIFDEMDDPKTERSCLLSSSMCREVLEEPELRQYLMGEMGKSAVRFVELLKNSQEVGDLPKHLDPAVVAQIIGTYLQGLRRAAIVSYDRSKFERQTDVFLTAFGL